MILPLPDKEIRKAIYDRINNTIPCYDYRVTGSVLPSEYVLMSTQTNQVNRNNKCSDKWESSILLEIVTRYEGSGNTGSRLRADEITNDVRALVNDLTLGGGLNVVDQVLDFPSDLATVTSQENIFRKFIRIELTIN